ncbi:MAG: acyltransferase [bacterium]|nr:acyltransferase [bacterium]
MDESTRTGSISNRIDWLDVAKGYGMLFVIFAHLDNNIIRLWIYTFHMPLFFFLSGYVFTTKYDFKTFLSKKIRTIIIPYFILGAVMILFQGFWNNLTMPTGHTDWGSMVVSLLVQKRLWTLWYIACLFWLNLMFYWIVKLLRKDIAIAIVSVICAAAGLLYYHFGGKPLFWNIDTCFTAMPFFFAGYWCKKHYEKIKQFLERNMKSFVLFVIMLAVAIVAGEMTRKISGKGLEMWECQYGCIPLTYLAAFAGIACVICVSHWFCPKAIRYIGRNSMLYYAWHQTIMIPLVWLLLDTVGIRLSIIAPYYQVVGYELLTMIIIVLILTIVNECIVRTKLRFIVGRSI